MNVKQNLSIFVGGDTETRNSKYNSNEKQTVNKKGNILAANLNMPQDKVLQKKKEAQEQAMEIIKQAYMNGAKIDDDTSSRASKIDSLKEEVKKTEEELKELEANRAQQKEFYGVEDDSQEQADLELLRKEKQINTGGSFEKLSKEEKQRLSDIKERGLTDYQQEMLRMDEYEDVQKEKIRDSKNSIVEENAIIKGIRLERLKSEPMLDAQKQAEEILENANKEIIGMQIDEAKEHVEDEHEEKRAEAKEKEEEEKEKEDIEEIQEKKAEMEALAEENKENVERKKVTQPDIPIEEMMYLDQIKTDVKAEVEEMVSKMKLLIEDIKGSVVDIEV